MIISLGVNENIEVKKTKMIFLILVGLNYSVNLFAQIADKATRDSLSNDAIRDTIMLNEVVITGKRPFMTLKDDKLVYHVENTVISNIGNAIDVLKRTPNIITDIDGAISMTGRDKTLVLINNKPIQNINELQLLNSSRIRYVEIIENPSAKYEAEGHAIVNIITKKRLREGINGMLVMKYTQGKRGGLSLIPQISYNIQKIQIFAAVNGITGRKKATNKTINHYERDNYLFESQVNNVNTEKYKGIGYTLDLHYNIDNQNEINTYIDGYKQTTTNYSYSMLQMNRNNIYQPALKIIDELTEFPNQNAIGLNYLSHLKTGGKFSFMSNYTRYVTNNKDDITENNTSNAVENFMQNNFNNQYDLYSMKSDLEIPLSVIKGRLECGGKYSNVSSSSNLLFKRRIHPNEWSIDYNFTNSINFREQTLAMYILMAGKWRSISYSIGLRGEYTYTDNSSVKNKSKTADFQTFPTVSFGYVHHDKTHCRFTFSRRISRPEYANLNNSLIYIDSLSTRRGNPLLKPTIYNTLSTNISYDKIFFGGFSYSYIEDPTNLMYINDPSNIERFTLYYDNVKNTWSVSANIGGRFDITKWWHSQLSASFSYSPVVVIDDGVEYMFKYPAYYINFLSQFSLRGGWNGDFNTKFYRPAKGMRKRGKRLDIDLGFSKKIWGDKMTIQGSVNCALFTSYQEFRYSYKYQSNDNDYNSRYSFQLGLIYNFGIKSQVRKIESSSADEVKRF